MGMRQYNSTAIVAKNNVLFYSRLHENGRVSVGFELLHTGVKLQSSSVFFFIGTINNLL